MITATRSGNLLGSAIKSLEATSQAVISMQLSFCFGSVATVVHITLLNPLDFLYIVPVNTNTELDLESPYQEQLTL